MSDLDTTQDPFATHLESSLPALGYRDGFEFNNAWRKLGWAALTPVERAEMSEYWDATQMNGQWDSVLLRQMKAHRSCWTGSTWARVPFTDAEKAAERLRFQGRDN